MKYLFGYINSEEHTKAPSITHERNVIFNRKLNETNIFAASNCSKTLQIRLENKVYFFYGRIKNLNANCPEDLRKITDGFNNKDFLCRLDGAFAACIYDLDKKKLFIKTDNFGQVPIYFFIKDNKFIFSTDTKYIFDAGINKEVDKVKVAEYLQFIHYSTRRTYFKKIYKIASKELIIVDFSNKYNLTRSLYEIDGKSKNNESNKVYSYLKKSFDVNYENNKSKGIFLSGGIDSSSVLSILHDIYHNQTINSYSFTFPFKNKSLEQKSSEKKLIDALTKNFNTKHIEFDGTNKDPFEYIDLSLSLTNTPSFFTNIYLFIDILEKARNNNIDILYSGIGGDTVISWGYESLRENFVKLKLIQLGRQIYQLARTRKVKISLIVKRIIYQEIIFEKFKNINVKFLRFFGFFVGVKDFIEKDLVTTSNLLKKISIFTPLNAKKYHKYAINAPDHELNNEILFHIFNHYDIEHVAPFYNLELINFCIAVHHEEKILNGIERAYFREALEGFIPELIRNNQKKANIGISFFLNFVKYGKDVVSKQLKNPHPDLNKYVELKKIYKKLYILNLKDENEILSSSKEIIDMYLVYVLNEWLKKNF